MPIIGLLWCILAFVWVQYLPGYLVSRLLVPSARGLERHALALVCAFSPVPLGVFLASVVVGLPMDATFLLVSASLINLALGWRLRGRGGLLGDIGLRDDAIVAGLALFYGLLLAFGVRSLDGGDVFATVHHCLYVIAMYAVANDPMSSLPLYDAITGDLMHYLVQHRTSEFNGLAPLFYEQRIGNAPIVGPPVALYGTVGWIGSSVLAAVVTTLCTQRAARLAGARPLAAWLAAMVLGSGLQVFCGYFINENTFAAALLSALMWFVLMERPRRGSLLLAGLVAGHLIGVRYTAALFWPALVWAVLWRPDPWRARWRALALWGGAAVVTTLPWLYINWIMLGAPFAHPKVHSPYAARVVENEIWGWRFRFRALNWPFTDEVVRTGWNPFPTFLWLPLRVAQVFGQGVVALALMGWGLLTRRRRSFVLLLCLAVPHTVAIGLLETLDWEQLTYAAPGLVPLGVALAVGLEGLLAAGTRRWAVVGAVIALGAVVGGSLAIRDLQFPVDTRRETAAGCATPAESGPGVEALRIRLTEPSLLPEWPVLRTGFAVNTWAALARLGPFGDALEEHRGLPVYPSGRAAILTAYSGDGPRRYEFFMDGRELREPDTPIRTSLGLHQIALRLPASRVKFEIERRGDNEGDLYEVSAIIEQPADEEQDFTVWVHPWNPPVSDMVGRVHGAEVDRPVSLVYGTPERGEERFILTNYPPDYIDIIDLDITVDSGGAPLHWGLLLFLADNDPERIETLILSGGHDMAWSGKDRATIRVPRNVRADTMLLYLDPYCSDHVPQYGDRYGVVRGPFEASRPVELRIDRTW